MTVSTFAAGLAIMAFAALLAINDDESEKSDEVFENR